MNVLDEFNQILDDELTKYLESLQGESPEPARSMETEAEKKGFPIVGPLVGQLLQLAAAAIKPNCIVELGSGFGYSAFWFARGYPGASIHLTDFDAQNLESAREYLAEASLAEDCHFHQGDALESTRKINDAIDLVFVDIDKEEYPDALKWAQEALEPGGWLIADNVLREGRVIDPDPDDTAAKAVQSFNEGLHSDPWTTSILPLRDGVAIARLNHSQ
ncbi:MAG: O-methyltransferase [bacterium]